MIQLRDSCIGDSTFGGAAFANLIPFRTPTARHVSHLDGAIHFSLALWQCLLAGTGAKVILVLGLGTRKLMRRVLMASGWIERFQDSIPTGRSRVIASD